MAVVISTAFFAHESIVRDSKEVLVARENWKGKKREMIKALYALKEASKGKPEYIAYQEKKQTLDEALLILNTEKRKNKFLKFDNIQQFFGEFWAFGLILYSFVNLLFCLRKDVKENDLDKIEKKGKIFFHSTFIFIGFFYFVWLFLDKDYSTVPYIIINLSTVLTLVAATYFISISVEKRRENYKKPIKNLIRLISDMRNHYLKMTTKAINSKNEEIIIKDIEIVEQKIDSTLLKVVDDTN